MLPCFEESILCYKLYDKIKKIGAFQKNQVLFINVCRADEAQSNIFMKRQASEEITKKVVNRGEQNENIPTNVTCNHS